MRLYNFGLKSEFIPPDAWRELTVVAFYRLFLSVTLFCAFYFKLPPSFLGSSDPSLYLTVSIIYICVAIILAVLTLRRWGRFTRQAALHLLLDIAIVTLIIRASTGLNTGMGSLLVVTVVAGGALIPGRLAGFIAATATLTILLEALYNQMIGDGLIKYSNVGLLGATFFATALTAQVFGHRLRETQQLADQHADDANKLSMLNKHIIERLQLGVIVVDSHNTIYSTNQAVQALLGIQENINGEILSEKLPNLFARLKAWRQDDEIDEYQFQPQASSVEISLQMIKLEDGDTLMFLRDLTELQQQAHRMKLVSLGGMAANIAHEIRNPLGAISHAAELLGESKLSDDKDIKLLSIIQRQSERVNGIIETVLQLSRRKSIEKTSFELSDWIRLFVDEFKEQEGILNDELLLEFDGSALEVTVDKEQLRQILVNLCSNAWHYSTISKNSPQVLIRSAKVNNEVIIDVLDSGPGVSESILPQLFEPFHSERKGGTGLGLFLAREMAQANDLRLGYIIIQGSKGFFRLAFRSELQG